MKLLLRSVIAVSLPLAAVTKTHAVFDPGVVGADSQWALHLDLNTLRQSLLGKEVVDMAVKAMPQIADGSVQVDLQKLLATVGSITAYGSNFSEDPNLIDGTLIFQGTPDLRKIAEGFVAQATVTTPEKITELKDLPFEAYSVGGQVIVAFPPEPVVLVSKSKAQVMKAREVFRGKAPSLAKNNASPLTALLKNPGRTYLTAASVVPSDKIHLAGPQARILQMANSGSISLGERDTKTFANLQLQASNDEMAEKLMKILQGITAMASLAESSDKHLTEFIQSVAVERQNKTVSLSLSYSSDRLVQMLQSQQKREMERRQNRQASRPSRPSPKPKIDGKLIAEWKADQGTASITFTPETLVSRTIENVTLAPGALITLAAQREDGEMGRIDCIEIIAAQGATPTLRFEAEHMKLSRFTTEDSTFASGGTVVTTQDNGTAQFSFPGAGGTYTLKVFYADESDGQGTFSVSVRDPKVVQVEAK